RAPSRFAPPVVDGLADSQSAAVLHAACGPVWTMLIDLAHAADSTSTAGTCTTSPNLTATMARQAAINGVMPSSKCRPVPASHNQPSPSSPSILGQTAMLCFSKSGPPWLQTVEGFQL